MDRAQKMNKHKAIPKQMVFLVSTRIHFTISIKIDYDDNDNNLEANVYIVLTPCDVQFYMFYTY